MVYKKPCPEEEMGIIEKGEIYELSLDGKKYNGYVITKFGCDIILENQLIIEFLVDKGDMLLEKLYVIQDQSIAKINEIYNLRKRIYGPSKYGVASWEVDLMEINGLSPPIFSLTIDNEISSWISNRGAAIRTEQREGNDIGEWWVIKLTKAEELLSELISTRGLEDKNALRVMHFLTEHIISKLCKKQGIIPTRNFDNNISKLSILSDQEINIIKLIKGHTGCLAHGNTTTTSEIDGVVPFKNSYYEALEVIIKKYCL